MLDLKLLVMVFIGLISYLHFSAVQYSTDLEASNVWDIATTQTYGHSVDDFGVLGDDGLLVAWVDPQTFKGTCSIYSQCHFVRLASMVPCQAGYLIEIQVLDKNDAVLFNSKLQQTIVPVGSITLLEVDYRTVPEGGAILLTGAGCSEELPAL